MNQIFAVCFCAIHASQDCGDERWGWFGGCGCQRPNRTSCWRSHCGCCWMSVIIQHHLIRYQHHLITYPRTSHSMKGVMHAHPAQWAKAKICTLVLGQGFRCRLVDCFCKRIARSNKAVLSLHHCLIEQGLIWCLVQADLPLLICQCWACSVNGCLFPSKSIIWMYWLKRIFFSIPEFIS